MNVLSGESIDSVLGTVVYQVVAIVQILVVRQDQAFVAAIAKMPPDP